VQKPGANKRQKERARRDEQREKEAGRATRARSKPGRPGVSPGEDPDFTQVAE